MSFEYEQCRLEALMDEVLDELDDFMVEADDDAKSFADDHVKMLENCSNDSEDDVPVDYKSAPKHKVPIFIPKNETEWRKQVPNRANVITRSRNIVPNLPGPKQNIEYMGATFSPIIFSRRSFIKRIYSFSQKTMT